MPRHRPGVLRRSRASLAVSERNALTAAAVTVNISSPAQNIIWGGTSWQAEAFDHYDGTPELHRAATDMAEAFSRVKLMVVDVDPVSGELGETPTDNETAGAIGAAMFGGRTGQAQAQAQIAQHLTLTGECWVLASDQVPDVTGTTWQILSVSEVTRGGSTVQIEQLDGQRRYLLEGELLFRLFRPHPRKRWQADSPTLGAITVLRELAGFSAQVMASIRSRLASAGVWLLPDTAQLPPEEDEMGVELPGGADAWMRLLGPAMMAAIQNPGDPSAVVPIIAMLPEAVIAKIGDPKKFVTDVITELQPMREAAIKRLAVGMDQPPERLLGLGPTNHWSAWMIDESFVKGPLSADLSYPADAFTRFYLRPALSEAGLDPKLFAIAFDVSMLLPDVEATHAQQAYDSGALAERVYLEALGFDPDRDAAPPVERADRMIEFLLKKATPDTLGLFTPVLQRLYPGVPFDFPAPPNDPAAQAIDDAEEGVSPPVDTTPIAPVNGTPPSSTVTKAPPARPNGTPANGVQPPAPVGS